MNTADLAPPKWNGYWWLPPTEELGLKWFNNPRGERPEVIDATMKYIIDPQDKIALDCGAHVGTWTLELAKHFKHTHAFEPILTIWTALRHNIAQRKIPLERVTTHLAAVGDRMTNCCPTFCANASMSSHLEADRSGAIPVWRLDAVSWGKIGLIKLDVEGYEWHALVGAENILVNHHPVIVIEWKPHRLDRLGEFTPRIEALLKEHGYELAEQQEIDRIYV